MPARGLARTRAVPFIAQMETTECGAASLAMVLAYHGHHAPLSEVRGACGTSREGATAKALAQAARGYGCEAEGVRAGLEDLGALPLPAILHWRFRHFVVLERVRKRSVVIVDPAHGRVVLSFDQCRPDYTGIAVVVAPGPDFKPRRRARPSLARYRQLVRDSLPALGQILGASMLLQVVAMVFPAATQFLIDHVILPRHEPWLWALGIGLTSAALARSVLTAVRGWALQQLQLSIDFNLMVTFLRHLLRLPLSFFLYRRTGDLAQRVQGSTTVRTLIANQTVSTVLDGLQLIGYAALMIAYSPKLAVTVLTVGSIRLPLLVYLRRAKKQLMMLEQAAAGRESTALVEAFSAFETTKACGTEGYVFGRWADRATERANANLTLQQLGLSSGQLMGFLQTAGLSVVFWLGGHEVLSEQMTLGTFTAFLALQAMFLGPIESLPATVDQFQAAGVQLMRMDDVLEAAVETSGNAVLQEATGTIEMEGVRFSYGQDAEPALEDVSLSIQAGEKVALVGPTGSGKSTLARLLLGMYQPDVGHVRFDGCDSRDLHLEELRRRFGVVMQEVFLFDDTIRANLSLGHPELSLDDLRRAAWHACIDDFIDGLPDGFDTQIGENGRTLSGGQRQRLALARAIAHGPTILLLDEATSALDLEMEARVHERLRALRCTCIAITHRLATVGYADRVVVLNRGRIVQSGPHARLSGEPGLFRELLQAIGRPVRAELVP